MTDSTDSNPGPEPQAPAAPLAPGNYVAYCRACGIQLDPRAVVCPACGVAQAVYPAPPIQSQYPQRKDPVVAIILSFLCAGLGHLYVGEDETSKGAVLIVCYGVSAFFSLFLIGIPFLLGLWIYAMISANTAALAYNSRHGYP